jgi:hypothetical protein
MFAAAEIPSLDVIACFIQHWHSVLFRKREGGRNPGDMPHIDFRFNSMHELVKTHQEQLRVK